MANIGEVSLLLTAINKAGPELKKFEESLKRLKSADASGSAGKQLEKDFDAANKEAGELSKGLDNTAKKLGDVKNASSGIKEVGEKAKKSKAEISALDVQLNKLTKNLDNIAKKTNSLGNKLTVGFTAPVIGGLVLAANASQDLEATLANIIGLTGTSKKVAAEFKDEILKLAPAVGKTPQELAEGLYFVASSGFAGKEALDILTTSAKASASGLGETKVIADLLTSAINAYGKENITSAQAADILTTAVREGKLEADKLSSVIGGVLPIASQMGVEFHEVAAALAAMSRTGTGAEEAATQLNGIMASLLNPTKQAEDQLKDLGLSAAGLRKELRDKGLLATLDTLNKKFKGNEEAAGNVFGNIRALKGVFALMGANASENVAIFDALKKSTGALDTAFGAVAETNGFKLKQALQQLQVVMIKLGDKVLPKAAEFANKFFKFFTAHEPEIMKFIDTVFNEGFKVVETAFKTVTDVLKPFASVFVSFLKSIGGGNVAVGLGKVAGALFLFGPALKVFSGGVGGISNAIKFFQTLKNLPGTSKIKQLAAALLGLNNQGGAGTGIASAIGKELGSLGSVLSGGNLAGIGARLAGGLAVGLVAQLGISIAGGLLHAIGRANFSRQLVKEFDLERTVGRELSAAFQTANSEFGRSFRQGFVGAIPFIGGALNDAFDRAEENNLTAQLNAARTSAKGLSSELKQAITGSNFRALQDALVSLKDDGVIPTQQQVALLVRTAKQLGQEGAVADVNGFKDALSALQQQTAVFNTKFQEFVSEGLNPADAAKKAQEYVDQLGKSLTSEGMNKMQAAIKQFNDQLNSQQDTGALGFQVAGTVLENIDKALSEATQNLRGGRVEFISELRKLGADIKPKELEDAIKNVRASLNRETGQLVVDLSNVKNLSDSQLKAFNTVVTGRLTELVNGLENVSLEIDGKKIEGGYLTVIEKIKGSNKLLGETLENGLNDASRTVKNIIETQLPRDFASAATTAAPQYAQAFSAIRQSVANEMDIAKILQDTGAKLVVTPELIQGLKDSGISLGSALKIGITQGAGQEELKKFFLAYGVDISNGLTPAIEKVKELDNELVEVTLKNGEVITLDVDTFNAVASTQKLSTELLKVSNKNVKVTVDASQAFTAIQSLQLRYDRLKGSLNAVLGKTAGPAFNRGGVVQRFARGGAALKPVYASRGLAVGADIIPAVLRKGEVVMTPNISRNVLSAFKNISRLPNTTPGRSQGGLRQRIEKIDRGLNFNVKNFYGTNTQQGRRNGGSFAYGVRNSLAVRGY